MTIVDLVYAIGDTRPEKDQNPSDGVGSPGELRTSKIDRNHTGGGSGFRSGDF